MNPTAALDTESELAVPQAIAALAKERTVTVIAHRLLTIVAADSIMVFDAGRLLETGDHATLLSQQGKYHAMWEAQQRVKQWRLRA